MLDENKEHKERGNSEDKTNDKPLAETSNVKADEPMKEKKLVEGVVPSDKEEKVTVTKKDGEANEDTDKPDTTLVDEKPSKKNVENRKDEEEDDVDIDDIDDEQHENNNDDDVEHDADTDEEEEDEEEEKQEKDYSGATMEELLKELQLLVKSEPVYKVKNKVDHIKHTFNQKYNELVKKQKRAFIADGGNEIDFFYSNPVKTAFNDLLFEYKTKRELYYKNLEQEQRENLAKRLSLIEELKQLIDNAEPATMYGQFKELQEKWRGIGKIPRSKYNDTWRTYQHHVERFYDLLHLSNDFRDLDFKHNYEEKLKLAERAEELATSNDLQHAFKELQSLHKMWKEDIGPVAREHREEIWNRFSEATRKIHEKRHEFLKELESKFEENAVVKREIIAQIGTLLKSGEPVSHKAWQLKIRELEKLRKDFFATGKVPRHLNEKIWKEFKEASRAFNSKKNNYYKEIKKDQLENLEKKNALVAKAEAYKNSEDWEEATEVMKQIQAEWKTIGHVPRKYSDKIWKHFKEACNHYFDRLHSLQDEENADQIELFNKKKDILSNLKSQADKEDKLSLEVINAYLDDWHQLGRLTDGMGHIESKFNKLVNSLYAKLDLNAKDLALLKFRNIIDSYLSSKNYRKLDNEQLFVRKKIDELTREIQQLENNISFISNADDDNPILRNVHQNIDNYNEQLETWKAKLDYLASLDY